MPTQLGKAIVLLQVAGFGGKFELAENTHPEFPGLRWKCTIDAFAPVFGGKARDWGFTPLEAAINALGCKPERPAK